jgi:hypothetical protein
VSKFESRRVSPYPNQLARLASALGVDADDADCLLEEVKDDDAR